MVLFAVMDWTIPTYVRLLSGNLFGSKGEDPDEFYRRYRRRIKVRVGVAVLLGGVAAIGQGLPLPPYVKVATLALAIVAYGAVIFYYMIRART